MADINLKTEVPDTSLPSTGFLFGADSQSAASPSVYSTQAVATALLGSTSLTGATVTADSPVLNLAQTWDNSGVTFTGLKFNVPTDSSAAGSLLMDLQVGGSSRFKVAKDGSVYGTLIGSSTATLGISSSVGFGFYSTNRISVLAGGQVAMFYGQGENIIANGRSLVFSSDASGSGDLFLTRRAAANLRLGAADAAAPVAQTLSVQSVVAGTTNTAGANLTITGSQGTGTGAGGSIVFQVAPAGSSGTAQNALSTMLTVATDNVYMPNGTQGLVFGTNANFPKIYADQSYWVKFRFSGVDSFTFSSSGTITTSGASSGLLLNNDTILTRDAANTLALRNGANAQFLRVYSTFTDASNYERGAINTGADFVELAAETAGTGDDNLDVRLTPAGTGNVRFGTHTATADTAVSGYIEIKDAGGTIRKLAVIT